MNYGEHRCLACNFHVVPVFRAFCKHCFVKVPWRMRADVMHAYRLRVTRPTEFNEQLIHLRQWVHETGREQRRDQ